MMRLPEIFTAVFVFVSILSLLFGVYTFLLKRSAPENRVFFCLCSLPDNLVFGAGDRIVRPIGRGKHYLASHCRIGMGYFF